MPKAFRYCNFSYSLLGIETCNPRPLIIPSSELQFLLLPIRDWNIGSGRGGRGYQKLQFLLLPIRDWNKTMHRLNPPRRPLQFLLLPIRDWNATKNGRRWRGINCNFSYSLLGIETPNQIKEVKLIEIAISLTPY